ncbi:MAG: hypothetical protein ACLUE1_05455 [Adlercreutzia equolifaciens]
MFALLAQGRSIPYIRDELIISRETAATHANIYAKLERPLPPRTHRPCGDNIILHSIATAPIVAT